MQASDPHSCLFDIQYIDSIFMDVCLQMYCNPNNKGSLLRGCLRLFLSDMPQERHILFSDCKTNYIISMTDYSTVKSQRTNNTSNITVFYRAVGAIVLFIPQDVIVFLFVTHVRPSVWSDKSCLPKKDWHGRRLSISALSIRKKLSSKLSVRNSRTFFWQLNRLVMAFFPSTFCCEWKTECCHCSTIQKNKHNKYNMLANVYTFKNIVVFCSWVLVSFNFVAPRNARLYFYDCTDTAWVALWLPHKCCLFISQVSIHVNIAPYTMKTNYIYSSNKQHFITSHAFCNYFAKLLFF